MEMYVDLPFGYDERDSHRIQQQKSPDLLGVRSTFERVQRAPGSQDLGTGTITGTPRNFLHGYEGSSQLTERFLMFNSARMYSYDPSTNAWSVVNGGVGEADFGTPVVIASGGVDRYSVVHTLGSIFFSSPNDNTIYAYNGGVVQRFTTLGYLPTGLTGMAAYNIIPFGDRLVLCRTLENSGAGLVDKKVRLRWHIVADVSDWNSDGAGFLDLMETSQAPIVGAAVLSERAYIFKERQIIELVQTGDVNNVFRTEVKVHGTGMVCRHSWAATEDFGFFVGPDDVYMWDGTRLQSIGQPIRTTLFAQMDFSTLSNFMGLSKVQGAIYTPNGEYWLLVQGADSPNVFIYDYKRDRWYLDHLTNATALGVFRMGNGMTTSIGQIYQSEFMLHGVSADVPQRMVEDLNTRDGSAFTSYVTTRDYPSQEYVGGELRPAALDKRNSCWEFMWRGLASTNYQLAYSIDGGATYTTDETVATNSGGIGRWFFGPVTYNQIRFRLKAADSVSFEVRQALGYRWKMAGWEYGANA